MPICDFAQPYDRGMSSESGAPSTRDCAYQSDTSRFVRKSNGYAGYQIARLMSGMLDRAGSLQILPALASFRNRWQHHRLSRATRELISAILRSAEPGFLEADPTSWTCYRIIPTLSEVIVIAVGPEDQCPEAIIKLPQTNSALTYIQRQSTVIRTLSSDPRLGDWVTFLPTLVAEGEIGGQGFVVERAMSGHPIENIIVDPKIRLRVQSIAAETIGELHKRTTASVIVGPELLERWIHRPMSLIREWNSTLPGGDKNDLSLQRLAETLHATLAGRKCNASWIHGDFWVGNLLAQRDGSALTGIVDWDLAMPDSLPVLDIIALIVSDRVHEERCVLGDIIQALLRHASLTSHEMTLLEPVTAAPGDAHELRTFILLYWLHHIAASLSRSSRRDTHWIWIVKNFETVLRHL